MSHLSAQEKPKRDNDHFNRYTPRRFSIRQYHSWIRPHNLVGKMHLNTVRMVDESIMNAQHAFRNSSFRFKQNSDTFFLWTIQKARHPLPCKSGQSKGPHHTPRHYSKRIENQLPVEKRKYILPFCGETNQYPTGVHPSEYFQPHGQMPVG